MRVSFARSLRSLLAQRSVRSLQPSTTLCALALHRAGENACDEVALQADGERACYDRLVMTEKRPPNQERIVTDPEILVGKPTVKGTRIPVELVLAHLAENPDLADLFAAYPRLTLDDVRACLAYAEQLVNEKGRRLTRSAKRERSARHPV